MPLSEQEQRLLEEMERSLYHNDADFVATVGAEGGKPNYRSIVVGILVAIAGIARHRHRRGHPAQPIVGIIGFVIMFAGVLLALSRPRQRRLPLRPRSGGPAAPAEAARPDSWTG